MKDQRQLFRIGIHRQGFLRRRDDTTVCEISDLTETGLQVVTEMPLLVGETVAIEFHLIDRIIIHCSLLVTHAGDLRIGGRIIHMSAEHREALMSFLHETVTANLVGMGMEPE